MKVTIDLPDTTTAVSLSYIFSDDMNENLLIGSSILTESALKSGCFECKGSVNNVKTEAYKEFAERLKEEMQNVARMESESGEIYFLISEQFVDNFLKEMVGEG